MVLTLVTATKQQSRVTAISIIVIYLVKVDLSELFILSLTLNGV